ncbi:MAG TPA: hypothetical protein PLA38_01520 [bacterium]|nr:hypothetical protein [bacterium]
MKKGYMRIIIVAFLMFLSNFQRAQAVSYLDPPITYDSYGVPILIEEEEEFCPLNPHAACQENYYNYNNDSNNSNTLNAPSQQLTGDTIKLGVSAITTQGKPIIFTPQVGLPGFMSKTALTANSTIYIARLMKGIFSYAIQIITVIALIVIIIGGFLWSIAGGNGQKVTEAKQWIFSGLGGLSLTLFAYLILRTINIGLVNFKPTKINTVTGLTINTKSNQEQATDDRGFLDHIYSETFGSIENLDSEACCIVYNKNNQVSGKTDYLHVASVAYSMAEDNFDEVQDFCLDYAATITTNQGEGNGKKFNKITEETAEDAREIFVILSKDEYTNGKSFNSWTLDDFKSYTKDLALFIVQDSACWGIDSGPIGQASEGLDSPAYCNGRDHWACIITTQNKGSKTRYWGYCEDGTCKRCLSYGQTCQFYYQCPSQNKIIGNSTIIQGWQCGSAGASSGNNTDACHTTYHKCVCDNKNCYNECASNCQNTKALKHVCTKK